MRQGKWIALAGGLMTGLMLVGCLVDMGRNRNVEPRRVFVNDAAANDSLPGTLITQGLNFVLQPNKNYVLKMKDSATGGVLDLYARGEGGNYSFQQSITGVSQGAFRNYTLQPTKNFADYYLAFLRSTTGGLATRPDSVRLVPVDTSGATTLAVRLLMVGQLQGLASETAKATYAEAFHTELRSIYEGYGITIDTSTVIVEPDADPFTVEFGSGGLQIPGQRNTQGINIYLVDDIQVEESDIDGTILGFAPREALDMASSLESRVVLNVRGSTGSTVARADSMAVTAAHEIGHFLGLRHTSATEQDRSFDEDESNRNDGFASTPFCIELTKRAPGGDLAREITIRTPDGRPYCLRVMGTSTTCGCSEQEVENLMFPYRCSSTVQKTLGDDQSKFVRNNLHLYQQP